MSNYIQIDIPDLLDEQREITIAQLALLDFEGFEETENGLKAYVLEENFNKKNLSEILDQHELKYTSIVVAPQNWNALWESNFEPVLVDDFCEVRADFHRPSNKTRFEVIITPKMSFGTGHHATTYMMIEQMKKLSFEGSRVADFGTGTAILAILAEKLGSKHIVAIDNDDWSIENSFENLQRNNSKHITLVKADRFEVDEKFDIILANINKNVILENFAKLAAGLTENGRLLISGILKEDEKEMLIAAATQNIKAVKTVERNNWLSILFQS